MELITDRVESNVLIITIEDIARLNESRPEEFRLKLQETLENYPGVSGVVLDITKVDFFSSTAIATLVLLKKGVVAKSGRLIICGMHPDVLSALKIVRLDKFFEVEPDVAGALAAIGSA